MNGIYAAIDSLMKFCVTIIVINELLIAESETWLIGTIATIGIFWAVGGLMLGLKAGEKEKQKLQEEIINEKL